MLVPRSLPVAALLGALAFGGPAAAQNLLDNPDFDAGSLSWQLQNGTRQLVADSGSCALSQAVEGTTALSGTLQVFGLVSETCVPVDGSAVAELQAGGMYRTGAETWSRIYLQLFSDAGCLGHLGWSSWVAGGTSAAWTRISGPIALTSDTRSVRLHIDNIPMVAGGPQFTVEWDRLYLGAAPELLVDGFETESGSACRWSTLVD
ncbi:MAG: hypothetical protein F9K18_15440 [Thermoanaerobaculia bacterium]|nr:MAG: hypothetical protein F9K18_15440 [Thermoanaerobaculia bacterium]